MSRPAQAITVSLLIGILGIIASFISLGFDLEEKIGLDLLFRLRGSSRPPSDVVIVSLDKESADYLNLSSDPEESADYLDLSRNPEKWPRSLHARLIENLTKQGAAVIVFDILFDKPCESEESDRLFARAIGNAGNVVLCEYLEQETNTLTDEEGMGTGRWVKEGLTPPIPSLAQPALALAPFPLPKAVKVSQYWIFKEEAGDAPTLPVVAYQIFAFKVYDEFIRLLKKVSPAEAEKIFPDRDTIIRDRLVEETILSLRDLFRGNPLIGERMIEEINSSAYLPSDPKKKQILKSLIEIYQGSKSSYLNFYGPPGTIETVPYYKILQSGEESAVQNRQPDLRGKAVFVGLSEAMRLEQKDGYYTVYSQPGGVYISGVEIAASAFANLLENKPVRPAVFPVYFAVILFWGALLGIICLFTRPAIAAVGLISISALYLYVALFQFDKTGSWYPVTVPLFFQAPGAYFGILLWKFFKVNQEGLNIKKGFKKYLPEKEVEQLVRNLGDVKPDPQGFYGACLYTDVEHYTALSEDMDPKELSIFMNSYWKVIFGVIKRYDGIIADIKGDSTLAYWEPEQPDISLRRKACSTALDISNALEQFNKNDDTPYLLTRIGLHYGNLAIGNIGSDQHYEYRLVGDTVNTVERIEELNKVLGTRILISKSVLDQIDGFLTRKVGEFILKGKSKPVVIYELISSKEEAGGQQRKLCEIFTEGLNAYYGRSWEKAINVFRKSMEIYKQDGPSTYYLKKCVEYGKKRPGDDWDGVICLDNK